MLHSLSKNKNIENNKNLLSWCCNHIYQDFGHFRGGISNFLLFKRSRNDCNNAQLHFLGFSQNTPKMRDCCLKVETTNIQNVKNLKLMRYSNFIIVKLTT